MKKKDYSGINNNFYGKKHSLKTRLEIRRTRLKGGSITSGYRMIVPELNSRPVCEHRYVWERKHGKIPINHIIHHKDGNKLNNNINNLKCMSIYEHFKLHRKQGDIPWKAAYLAVLYSGKTYESRRKEISSKVINLSKRGASEREISLYLKKNRQTIHRILRENLKSKYLPRKNQYK